jgi:DNA adenine methylase
MEVYNDIHSALYLFFKLIRENNQELIHAIQLTPNSREEFNACKDWQQETDVLERVRKFYALTMQAIGTVGGWSYSKSCSRRGMTAACSKWLKAVDEKLPDCVERLREVQIEKLDILELIEKYDGPETLFYLDPPYVQEARKAKNQYAFEMSMSQYQELVKRLLNLKGKAILSGYDHEVYRPLEAEGYRKVFLGAYGKQIQKAKPENYSHGNEFVWINYERVTEPTGLLHTFNHY